MKRRTLLQVGAALALCASPLRQVLAAVRPVFQEKNLNKAMQELLGGDAYEESAAVQFKAPEIAENGAVVPLTASYKGDAKQIAFFVEENPQPLAAVFALGAGSVANVSTRIKMGKSSIVHAVVQTADGKLLGVAKDVKVTIGGCGG